MSRDVVAVVAVFDQCRPAALIFRIGETRNKYTPRQCIHAMRSDSSAGGFLEIVDRLYVSRFCWISVHVENKHAAGVKPREPELVSVVGEPAVVCFVAAL